LEKGEELEGLLFHRLIERRPDVQTDLLVFREHLISGDNEQARFRQLKRWEMRGLSYH
jgi:hypothetical protein